jgi:hypothetical protein
MISARRIKSDEQKTRTFPFSPCRFSFCDFFFLFNGKEREMPTAEKNGEKDYEAGYFSTHTVIVIKVSISSKNSGKTKLVHEYKILSKQDHSYPML